MYAQVILPLSLANTYTYLIPDEMITELKVGHRVVVEFASRKLYTGIIERIHHNYTESHQLKPILSILDENPIVNEHQLMLWRFIADYYMCSLGDVYRNAIPSALKLESETFIRLRRDKELIIEQLDEYETLIIQAVLNKTSISLKEIESFIPKKFIISTLKYLYDEQYIEIDEKITSKYKRKEIPYVKLHDSLENDSEKLKEILLSIDKIDKQRNLLLQFLSLKTQNPKPVSKKELLEITNSSPAILKALENKNILQVYYIFSDRLKTYNDDIQQLNQLTNHQLKALEEINIGFKNQKPVLLFGVSSSGKTEIYIHQILQSIEQDKQVLLLLPEIAITTQIVYRLQKKFGNSVGVYHSKLSTNERVEVWMNCLQNKYNIIIGTRASIFLPFSNLDLIIVDEEHDIAYKQNDLKPFFNAKDASIYLSKKLNINLLLGSATPSLESYYATKTDKFHLVELNERFYQSQTSEIELISLQEAYKLQEIQGEFSLNLIENIKQNKEKNLQSLIFVNRRGFSPVLECNTCGFSPKCPHCDVHLTFHKYSNDLKCHYCGYREIKTKYCKVCNSTDNSTKGIGTQLIEEQLFDFFKSMKIERMDFDTMRKKDAYEKLFERLSLKDIDILVGTQMISKGLDFEAIGLVGVVRADALLQISDFRAEERAMQLLTQLIGRAGRRNERGKVIIQTFKKEALFYQFLVNQNLKEFYEKQLNERKEFFYPPFTKIIQLEIKHKKLDKVRSSASFLTKLLAQGIPTPYLLGPVEQEHNRINNIYFNKIIVKIPPTLSLSKTKNFIKECVLKLKDYSATKQVLVVINVDV